MDETAIFCVTADFGVSAFFIIPQNKLIIHRGKRMNSDN